MPWLTLKGSKFMSKVLENAHPQFHPEFIPSSKTQAYASLGGEQLFIAGRIVTCYSPNEETLLNTIIFFW